MGDTFAQFMIKKKKKKKKGEQKLDTQQTIQVENALVLVSTSRKINRVCRVIAAKCDLTRTVKRPVGEGGNSEHYTNNNKI